MTATDMLAVSAAAALIFLTGAGFRLLVWIWSRHDGQPAPEPSCGPYGHFYDPTDVTCACGAYVTALGFRHGLHDRRTASQGLQ